MATKQNQTLVQRIALDGGDEIKRELLSLGRAGESAFKALERQAKVSKQATTGLNADFIRLRQSMVATGAAVQKLGRNFSFLGGTVGQLGGILAAAFSADVLINATSAWTDYKSRVQLAIGATEDADAVLMRLSDTAKQTFTSLDATATQFADNSFVLNALGKSTKTQLDLQESLNNVLVVSGARGQRLEQVQRSFSNALSLGALRGEDFNNVQKAGGRLLELLAAKLNVSVDALKGMAAQGLITRDVLIETLLDAQKQVAAEAAAMPMTIRDAFTNLNTSFITFIGTADQASGVSAKLAEAIAWVGDNLDTLIPLLLALIGVFLTIKAVNLAKDFYDLGRTIIKDVIPAVVGLTRTLLANPWILVASLVALFVLRIIDATIGFDKLGEIAVAVGEEVFTVISNLVGPVVAFVAGINDAINAFLRWTGIVKGESDEAANATGEVESAVDDTTASLDDSADAGATAGEKISSGFKGAGDFVKLAATDVDSFTESLSSATAQAKALVAQVSKLNASSGEATRDLVPTFAGGGSVRGPGTSRSDSILARLSNGEFVMRAKAVKKWGLAALQRMNAGVPAFATGGLVSNFGASAPAFAGSAPAGGSGRPFTLVLDGQSFGGLSASDEVADSLVRFASTRKVRKAGKRPSWS